MKISLLIDLNNIAVNNFSYILPHMMKKLIYFKEQYLITWWFYLIIIVTLMLYIIPQIVKHIEYSVIVGNI